MNQLESLQVSWIIPCDNSTYDIDKAFGKYPSIDWKQSTNVHVGDMVYIYSTAPQKYIGYKCKALEVDKVLSTIDDEDCVINGSNYENHGRYMELEFLHQYDESDITLEDLKLHGLKSIQGPCKATGELLDFILSVDDGSINRLEKAVDDFKYFVESKPEQKGMLSIDFNSGYLLAEEGFKKEFFNFAQNKIKNDDSLLPTITELLSNQMHNLVDYHQIISFEDIALEKKEKVINVLKNIYFGEDDKRAFINAVELFGKKYDLISFLFYIKDDKKYFPMRPTYFEEALKRIGYGNMSCTKSCTWENYSEFNNFIVYLSTEVLPNYFNCSIEPIDAHTFLWILSPKKGAKKVKIQNIKKISEDDLVNNSIDDDKLVKEIRETEIEKVDVTIIDEPHIRKELIESKGRKEYPRDKKKSINALSMANHKCEIDCDHPTFISKSSNLPYTEPHHLIPIAYYDSFDVDLDCEANIVSLCSNCHNQIHYGKDAKELIAKLFYERKERLEKTNVFVTLDGLLEMYGIK